MHNVETNFRKTINELKAEKKLSKYIDLLTTLLSCDRVKTIFIKKAFDAYFIQAMNKDILNNDDLTELELADSKLNLLINYAGDNFFIRNELGKEAERE